MKPRPKAKVKASPPPPRPYTDLTSEHAVERLMSPDGGLGVIDFWAPWCAPCRAVAPHFEAVAARYAGAEPRVGFYKVNTQDWPRLAAAFNVRSIPTMVFVSNGEILDVVVGALDGRRLAAKVDWLLSKGRGEGFWDRLLGRRKPPPGASRPEPESGSVESAADDHRRPVRP
jgi:thioredoxin 1